MHSPTLRKGSELSLTEKTDIFTRMSLSGIKEERDSMREYLAQQYGITEGAITSLIAHETMRKMKQGEGVKGNFQTGMIDVNGIEGEGTDKIQTKIVQESTQTRVYTITTLSQLTEEIRDNIRKEFFDIIQENASNPRYDFYLDIEAISDYYNINPFILEQFLRNSYKWLGEKLNELKKGIDLNEEDKFKIRIYVAGGENEKNKKVRRKEMAKKYMVSIFVISAITAWKIHDNGEKVLKKDDGQIKDSFIPKVNPETIPEISPTAIPLIEFDNQISQISEKSIGAEQADSENDGGEQTFSEADVGYIQELAPEYNLQDKVGRGEFLQHVFDLFPDATIEDVKRILPNFPDDVIHTNPNRGGEGMGALMEYDNEIKNKWRQKLKEFIDENTNVTKRKDMKVLCLPGIECLEIPLYLELGFNPDNIVGVEAGEVDPKKLKPEKIEELKNEAFRLGISFELTRKCIREILTTKFQINATKFGIQTRIGKLEKILETEETIFDVVSLDFLGPIGANTFDVMQQIKASNTRYLLLTNFLGKRDTDSIMPFHRAILAETLTRLNLEQDDLCRQLDEIENMDKSKALGLSRHSKSLTVGISCQLSGSTNILPFSKILNNSIEIRKKQVEAKMNKKESLYYRSNSDTTRRILANVISSGISMVLHKFFYNRIPKGIPIIERSSLIKTDGLNKIYLYLCNYFAYYSGDIEEYCMLLYGYKPTIQASQRYSYNVTSPMYSDFLVLEPIQPKTILELRTLNAFLIGLIRGGVGMNPITMLLRTAQDGKISHDDRIRYTDVIKIINNGELMVQIKVKDLIQDIKKLNFTLQSHGHIIQPNREQIIG
ncbi:MAG: hypothetical protein PHH70_00975 [Candidatus Gracilibacteria bacterium]|nr:hypothetical protein [Candidatus Gracilibacteria bacterium]